MAQAIRNGVPALVLLMGLMSGGCVTASPGEAVPAANIVASATDCSGYSQSDAPLVFHAMDPNIAPSLPASRISAVPGASIPIQVGHLDRPHVIRPVPLACMDWQISPADAARVSDDGLVLDIADHAAPGSEIRLTGTIRGSSGSAGSETLRIIILDEVSRELIGYWRLDETRDCDGVTVDPPLEIRFEAERGMSVTWTPFGRYWDYWGRYAWTPESGAFGLEVTGGNQVPGDVSETGVLALAGDTHLALSGFHFGTRERGAPPSSTSTAEAGCTLVFRRAGGGTQ